MDSVRVSPVLDSLVRGSAFSGPVVLVAAHPDDEIIGAGCRLHLLENLTIVHMTDGAPRDLRDARLHGFSTAEAYAAARQAELDMALSVACCAPVRSVCLGIPDQQATERMSEAAGELALLFKEVRPELILTHAYEGGHPDHDACAFAVHAAARSAGCAEALAEFTSYHRAHDRIETNEFLPAGEERIYSALLSPAEERHKQLMLDCFTTQREILAAFRTDVERFRLAPEYDFTRRPHPGRLYYEQFPWGMTGDRFCERATEALQRAAGAGAAV